MPSKPEPLATLTLLSQANSFLKSRNLLSIPVENLNFRKGDALLLKYSSYLARNEGDDNVAPSGEQLDKLLFHTIYTSDGLYNIVDFALQFTKKDNSSTTHNLKSLSKWIESKLLKASDQIEKRFKDLVESFSLPLPLSTSQNTNTCEPLELIYLHRWIKRQPLPCDSDILALRSMETFILLSIINFDITSKIHQEQDKYKSSPFIKLEEQLMDWSEGIGLIRSMSHHPTHHSLENSMDIDFNPSADLSLSSNITSLSTLKRNEFEIYLLEKFKNFSRIKEIVEIVSERCGIPLDSDEEDEKAPLSIINNHRNNNESFSSKQSNENELKFKSISKSKDQPKHWRRVKPVTLPIKRVTTSSVTRSSSLSLNDLKSSNRFLSTSSRQVDLDLALKPSNDLSISRRHSEASASSSSSFSTQDSQIIQHKTPTKTHKHFQFVPSASTTENNSNSNSILADAFVILETPPRPKPSTTQIHQNDLTSTVRRLFPLEK